MLMESLQLRFKNIELVNELTHRSADAEQASLAKSRFLAAASHELEYAKHYDHIVVNITVEQAVEDLCQILRSRGLEND